MHYKHMRTLTACSLILFSLVLGACSEVHEKYREPGNRACTQKALVDQYLVKYKDAPLVTRMFLTKEQLPAVLNDPAVEWVEPNYEVRHLPRKLESQSVHSEWQSAPMIGAEYAWARGFTGQGINIAVVDSGVDTEHPLLKRALARGSAERPIAADPNRRDDDGNGFIDDIYGWNFADNVAQPMDETGHGTHIAGIIASSHSAMTSFRGIAPDVGLIAADFMNSETGDEFNAIRAIDYAISRGAKIVNNSWSNFCSLSLRQAFESWQTQDVVFVNASGNDGLYIDSLAIYPANLHLANTITVGSVGSSGMRSPFSNYGKNVSVFAPGEEIFSLAPHQSGYELLVARSGTSMATAFVSGAVALAWSAHPEKPASEIVKALRNRAHSNGYLSSTPILNVRDLFSALR